MSFLGLSLVRTSTLRTHEATIKAARDYAEIYRSATEQEQKKRDALQEQLLAARANAAALGKAINADYTSGRVSPKKKEALRKHVTSVLTHLHESLKKG